MDTDDQKMRIQVTPKSLHIFRSLQTVESIKQSVRQWIKHCHRFLRILKSSKLHVLNFTWLACHAYTVHTADTQIWVRMTGIFVRHAVKFCLNGTCLLVKQHTLCVSVGKIHSSSRYIIVHLLLQTPVSELLS